MPYDPKSGQAVATFLSIKHDKGLAAAKAFGRKHRADISAAMKSNKNASKHKKHRGRGYQPRSAQGMAAPFTKKTGRAGGANRFTGRQLPPSFQKGTQA